MGHIVDLRNVWDLTAEVKFWNGRLGVFAGIKNLFDQDYWGEVRDEGIVLPTRAIITAASSSSFKRHLRQGSACVSHVGYGVAPQGSFL
jgi:hypothetical protein